jgi:hypothetical protein
MKDKKIYLFKLKKNLLIMIMRIFFLLYCVQAFTKVRMLKTSCSQHFNEMEKLIYKEETDEFHYITHSTIVWNYSCISYITFTDQSVWTYPIPTATPTNSPTATPSQLPTNSPTEM